MRSNLSTAVLLRYFFGTSNQSLNLWDEQDKSDLYIAVLLVINSYSNYVFFNHHFVQQTLEQYLFIM